MSFPRVLTDRGPRRHRPRDQHMVRIHENNTLADIVAAQHHIIAGHPIIYVVSTGTEFREKFLAGEWRI